MIDGLLKSLREHLASRPADAGEVLRTVADAMSQYETAQSEQRSRLADNALRGILCTDTVSRLPVSMIIDAMYHQFPRGAHRACSPAEHGVWTAFVEKIQAQPIDLEWLQSTRGHLCVQWYTREVMPAVVACDPSCVPP